MPFLKMKMVALAIKGGGVSTFFLTSGVKERWVTWASGLQCLLPSQMTWIPSSGLTVEGENWLPRIVLWLLHTCRSVCTPPHDKINVRHIIKASAYWRILSSQGPSKEVYVLENKIINFLLTSLRLSTLVTGWTHNLLLLFVFQDRASIYGLSCT